MRSREEGLLLFLLVAAALAAALFFRPLAGPARLHDGVHRARFEEARAVLPALGAVRVRAPATGPVTTRLEAHARGNVARVHSAERVRDAFRYGRLLGTPPAALEAVLAALRVGEAPDLPPPEDTDRWFQDAAGAYACDVVLEEGREAEGLAAIREALPEARLSGEPLAREADGEAAARLARPLLCALAAFAAWVALRRGGREAGHRLLAALASLAVAGVAGPGVDPWSLPAAAVAAAAPPGPALLCGAALLPFPAPALRRLGLVLVTASLVLLRGPATRRPLLADSGARPRGAAPALAVVVVLASAAAWRLPIRTVVPAPVQREACALLVPPAEADAWATALRAEGVGPVVGGVPALPPPADLESRRLLSRIHREAERNLATAPPESREAFRNTAAAAALDRMHLPSDLRARLETRDGDAVLWVLDPAPAGTGLVGAARYRAEGARQLAREARAGALVLFLLCGILALLRRRAGGAVPVLGRAAGAGAGMLVLALVPWSAPAPADMLVPILAAASVAPGWAAVPGLAAAGVVAPDLYAAPALALAACVAVAALSRPR